MRKWLLVTTCMLMTLGIIFSSGCGSTQQTSAETNWLEVQNNGTAIQWKYSDETDWHDLVALDELKGTAGENGKDGVDGKNGINGKDGTDGKNGTDGRDGVNGKDGTNGKDGIDGKDGVNGVNGKTVEVKRTDTHIQWRYEGEDWQNLVAIADITGPAGQKGADGANGKTPEFRINENNLQWRYVGDEIWLNLYDLSTLQGVDGKDGADGKNGVDGKNGADGKDGIDGKDGTNGKNGDTPFIGDNGNWWIGETDIGVKAEAEDGANGKDGEDGKTAEFRVDGNQLQWRYTGDTVWLNLYDLSVLKGADGKNGTDGTDGKDGKDGSCTGYFAANGSVYSWGALPFNVKKENGGLISYNTSSKTITLSKGHAYSLVFSGTVMVSANGSDKLCGAALIDGYNSSEMALETQTYVNMQEDSEVARLTVSYNTIYQAEEDITLTFQYTSMFSRMPLFLKTVDTISPLLPLINGENEK